jgi:hypothetical protein
MGLPDLTGLEGLLTERQMATEMGFRPRFRAPRCGWAPEARYKIRYKTQLVPGCSPSLVWPGWRRSALQGADRFHELGPGGDPQLMTMIDLRDGAAPCSSSAWRRPWAIYNARAAIVRSLTASSVRSTRLVLD